MRPQLLPAIAVGVATTLSLFNASPPALADIVTITYTGTISPWLWNGRDYYQGTLIDTTGIFGGGGLTGDPFTTTWTVVTDRIDSTSAVVGGSMYGGSAPILEAVLTINGYSVDFAAN